MILDTIDTHFMVLNASNHRYLAANNGSALSGMILDTIDTGFRIVNASNYLAANNISFGNHPGHDRHRF